MDKKGQRNMYSAKIRSYLLAANTIHVTPSIFREKEFFKNSGNFFAMSLKLLLLIFVCGIIGLLRNAIHVGLDAPFFYCFDADILFTMFFWPVHLFLFPGMLIHFSLVRLGYVSISKEFVFATLFTLQLLHLTIPFFDWLGVNIGMPYAYSLPNAVMTSWHLNVFYLTPGILFAWLFSICFVINELIKTSVKKRHIAIVFFILLALVIIPPYVFPTGANTIFNLLVGIQTFDPNSPRSHFPPFFIFWGCGVYLVLTSFLGGIYFLKKTGP